MGTVEIEDKKYAVLSNGSKLSRREITNGNLNNVDATYIPVNFHPEGVSTLYSKMLIFNKSECMYIDGNSCEIDEKHFFTGFQGSPFYVRLLKIQLPSFKILNIKKYF